MPDRPAPPFTVAEMFHSGTCQFITGDIHADHTFCGEAAQRVPVASEMKKLPYCAGHAARCYRRPPKTPATVNECAER